MIATLAVIFGVATFLVLFGALREWQAHREAREHERLRQIVARILAERQESGKC